MNGWKLVGLAGIVGAAVVGVASGAALAQRSRREFLDADTAELSARLHKRLHEAELRRTSPG